MIHIVLAGQAIGKQRVRFSRASGRAYTPEKTVSYEGRLAYAAQQAMNGRTPLEGPVAVEATIYVAVPVSKSKKRPSESTHLLMGKYSAVEPVTEVRRDFWR